MPDRRTFLLATMAALLPATPSTGAAPIEVTLRLGKRLGPVSPFLFGSNEIGSMDGGAPSASFDRLAGVSFRRLGGNLMTTYNWVNNAANAGRDWDHHNTFALADMLALSPQARRQPGAVIAGMHQASLDMGAVSLVTLPLAGYVAADADGPVSEAEAAPSARFVPVVWSSQTPADAPVDASRCDVGHLLRRLVARFGPAGSPTGIGAYALDNEPGLWAQTHPRVVRAPMTIAGLIDRSIAAATVIKAIDPGALVFGPASWGVTEFDSFQNAPDWNDFRPFGSFLAAYLDGMRKASDAAGRRLLDVLDIHWYPQSRLGELLRTDKPDLAEALLAAPRSLDEPGYREDSWVSDALPLGGDRLSLPILPSLRGLVDRWFPGTAVAVTEYNFGGPTSLVSGLAIADVLGRLASAGISYAAHWGNLEGPIGEAYRLYRDGDAVGATFSGDAMAVGVDRPDLVAAHAVHSGDGLVLVVINKSTRSVVVRLPRGHAPRALIGFDRDHPATAAIAFAAGETLDLPPRSARRLSLT